MERTPWGDSAHSALRWAYGMLARSESPPTVLGALRSPSRMSSGMTMLDYRAQAAVIRAQVERMTEAPLRAVLVAYYLPRPVKERVAGGGTALVDRWLEERRECIHALGWWLLGQQGTGAHRLRGHMEIVAQYTAGRESARRLARLLSVRFETAKAARAAGFEVLESLRQRALTVVGASLVRAELISAPESYAED